MDKKVKTRKMRSVDVSGIPNIVDDTASLKDLIPYAKNSRKHSEKQIALIAQAIKEYGFTNPVLVWKNNEIIAGHARVLAAEKAGMKKIPVRRLDHLSDVQRRALVIADNKLAMVDFEWDENLIKEELTFLHDEGFDLSSLGFDKNELPNFGDDGQSSSSDTGSRLGNLSEKFLIPPFSVLNAREGWWQDRKRAWIVLGIKSEVGRGGNALGFSEVVNAMVGKGDERRKIEQNFRDKKKAKAFNTEGNVEGIGTGTSIFDPVLCELAYTWFSPKNGLILDPFAGGSVRGIVASKLKRKYFGVDLRPEQIDANRAQAKNICKGAKHQPVWKTGDSVNINSIAKNVEADMIFSCPPYADLEVYSDDPKDLSTMNYKDFRKTYFEIIKKSCLHLKNDRFACFVVGEVRDKKTGHYYDFVGDTVQAFKEAGLEFHNEAILITQVGSLPIRVGKQFAATRRLGKTHQNVLVFVKGDPRKAVKALGDIDIYIPENKDESQNIEN